MGSDVKSKKRKAVPDNEVAKVKKVKQMASDVLPKKRKATDDAESTASKKSKNPKPVQDAESKAIKKNNLMPVPKSTQNSTGITAKKLKSWKDVVATEKQPKTLKGAVDLKHKQPEQRKVEEAKSAQGISVSDGEGKPVADASDEEEIDDQTEALLKGFESDDDEKKDPEDQGYEGQEIPKLDKKVKKKSKAAEKASTSDKPGVIYVGRIPHGFFEWQMREYFSQFGDITNVRLSRNRKTGKSKHYAFVEFKSAEVAEIVAKTMDNYLLFNHILKVKLIAPEQIHKDLWKGANRRFKTVPWNKLEGRKLKQGMTEAAWDRRVEKEELRRANKKAVMKSMGYEFESPKLRSAKDLPKRQQVLTMATNSEADKEVKAIEAPKEIGNEESKAATKEFSTEEKENGGGEAANTISGKAEKTEGPAALTEVPSKKKNKKKKKPTEKLDDTEETPESISDKTAMVETAETVNKAKKSKKKVKAV